MSGPDETAGLRGAYFASGDFAAEPNLIRQDPAIDFNWAIALAVPDFPSDGFSVRWSGYITPTRPHQGRIGFVTPDRVRFWLDGKLVIDAWRAAYGAPAASTSKVTWRAGQRVKLQIDWRKRGGGSVVWLGIGENDDGITLAAEIAGQAEVAVLALGESDHSSGEGIDRCDIGLPGGQAELFRSVSLRARQLSLCC